MEKAVYSRLLDPDRRKISGLSVSFSLLYKIHSGLINPLPQAPSNALSVAEVTTIIIMYLKDTNNVHLSYLINVLNAHMMHINLNMI